MLIKTRATQLQMWTGINAVNRYSNSKNRNHREHPVLPQYIINRGDKEWYITHSDIWVWIKTYYVQEDRMVHNHANQS